MSFGKLLFDLPAPTRNFVRLIEKTNKKIVVKECGLKTNLHIIKVIIACISIVYLYMKNICTYTWSKQSQANSLCHNKYKIWCDTAVVEAEQVS
jgi:hypothetical protein